MCYMQRGWRMGARKKKIRENKEAVDSLDINFE
jgi:hypothetical protein